MSKKNQSAETTYTPLVKHLTGIVPADIDDEQEYGRYLQEKYTAEINGKPSGSYEPDHPTQLPLPP